MTAINKQVIQDPTNRGCYNGDHNYIANFTGEITFDVTRGENNFLHYTRLDKPIKFTTFEDAIAYVTEMGATVGTVKNKPYYSICMVEGCCFTNKGFYSAK